MLLALCHRCWTWIEPKHERCVECGHVLDLQQPDPELSELKTLLGAPLVVLGEVSIKRPRLPAAGTLTAMEQGFLFLPDLRQLPTGGYTALESGSREAAGVARGSFWSLFTRKMQAAASTEAVVAVRPLLTEDSAAERFLDSPGALFIPRDAILRIILRGTMFRVERKPGKTVAWRIESPPAVLREHLHRLLDHPGWRAVTVAGVG